MIELTNDVRLWSKKLERCLNSMPAEIEISVLSSGSVLIMELGNIDKYFSDNSDMDDPGYLTVIIPTTSGRIDGRDSGI